jgi:23S rRNA (cytosine1962-C5)-methyltransferase
MCDKFTIADTQPQRCSVPVRFYSTLCRVGTAVKVSKKATAANHKESAKREWFFVGVFALFDWQDIMNDVILKKGREKSARQYHPWLYSGAVGEISGAPAPGEIVRVRDSDRRFVAWGYVNPASKIRVRLLEWDEQRQIDDNWWVERVRQAVDSRASLRQASESTAYRLIFGESDFLPGLIVDRYGDYLVAQFLTAGAERVKSIILSALTDLLKPTGIYERSDVDARDLEGLAQHKGTAYGQEPPDHIVISEYGIQFKVDLKSGQKTGFYLDQRENRHIAGPYAQGRTVLDCFGYTGGFALHALRAGAESVTLADASARSLAAAQENVVLNGLGDRSVEYVKGDAFEVLRGYRDAGRKFGMVILDPPKFATSRDQVKKALAAYKDINLLGMKLLSPGGILATFSCSGAISPESFRMSILWAAQDAGRQIQYLNQLCQPSDHPVLASFPESQYLTGCVCRVV